MRCAFLEKLAEQRKRPWSRTWEELIARSQDPKDGLAKLYNHIKGMQSPTTSVIQEDAQSQPTSNVEAILAIFNREWQQVFDKRKNEQPSWRNLEPLLRGALATIPPP